MKTAPSRVRKMVNITVSSIVITVVLTILFISPLTKYLLEKHDVKLIGRELTMDWAFVNPFTGYVHFNDLKIFELSGDSLFISADGVSANINLRQLLFKTIELQQLTIDHPWGKIVQRKDTLNFSDIIARFKSDPLHPNPDGWRFTFLDTKIIDGEFHYIEKIIPINYFIRNVNIESTGKKWSVDTLSATFSFQEGKNDGIMKGDFTVNTRTLDYRLAAAIHDFDLEIIRQYIWELINYGMFRARLDANINATGNFNSQDSISMKGRMVLRDFHLGKTSEDDYLAFKEFVVVMEEVSPIHHKYLFDSISLSDPYLKYERYDSLDNIEAMFGKKGQNISDVTQQPGRFNLVIEIARYIEVLSRNFFKSDYKIGQLAIHRADLVFNDYSLAEKFSIEATPLTIVADSVNKNNKRVGVDFTTGFKPFGSAKMSLNINPKDSSDFDLTFKVEKIPVTVFNPYFISYTSFPVDRGTIELNGLWTVRNGAIKSTNHVVMIDPRVTRRIRNDNTKWLPMPMIMAFVRERGNVIDYTVPITGNLKDPKFHMRDVVFDVIKNIFVKPATTPYRMKVKNLETEIEKSLTVKWEMRQHVLTPHQKKFVRKISNFLKDAPEATLIVQPFEYASKEGEYILFYETKKKFFLLDRKNKKDFTEEDSLAVSMMSVKDPGLVRYISKNLSDTVMFTLHEKCINFVGKEIVNNQMMQLVKSRETSFRELFLANGTESQVSIRATKNDIPFNGFSYFKLEYPGEIPRALEKAYQRMNDLNDEIPRKKYLNRRIKDDKLVNETGR
jgi:Domain of Unknown Function (DUF748)